MVDDLNIQFGGNGQKVIAIQQIVERCEILINNENIEDKEDLINKESKVVNWITNPMTNSNETQMNKLNSIIYKGNV